MNTGTELGSRLPLHHRERPDMRQLDSQGALERTFRASVQAAAACLSPDPRVGDWVRRAVKVQMPSVA
jgi:hypothetical protein